MRSGCSSLKPVPGCAHKHKHCACMPELECSTAPLAGMNAAPSHHAWHRASISHVLPPHLACPLPCLHTDIFLSAAQQLGVDPSNCVVIEDAVAGVQAARAAGGSPVVPWRLLLPGHSGRFHCVVFDYAQEGIPRNELVWSIARGACPPCCRHACDWRYHQP